MIQPYPHHYVVSAAGRAAGSVTVSSPSLGPIETAPPPQFGGPEGLWSPETLLCGAVANCFVLTFRGVARAARFDWDALDCRVEGTLERAEGGLHFTRFATSARLVVPPGADPDKARRLLEQTEQSCLVTRSLRGEHVLAIDVVSSGSP